MPDDGLKVTGEIISRAEDDLRLERPRGAVPEDADKAAPPAAWTPDPDSGLPPDCPVTVLGVNDGVLYLIDAAGQLMPIPARGFSDAVIQYAFGGRNDYLRYHWPNKKKSDFDVRAIRGDLLTAAQRRGVWNAVESVRGLGAWRGDDGRLIWHCGDGLFSLDSETGRMAGRPPGEVEGYFYPARARMPHPHPEPVTHAGNPARHILKALKSWNWERPDVAPFLVLGHIGAMLLSGALEWRPSMFLVGDKAVGKTTLQDIILLAVGEMLLRTEDTTAAGLYQQLNMDARPVAIDEFEPTEDNFKRVQAIMSFMRIASSGGLMLRGGSDHGGVQFRARSAFLFSAINSPAVNAADISRLCVLNLRRIDSQMEGSAPPVLMEAEKIPGRLMTRLSSEWGRLDELLGLYREALRLGGHDARGQDTYGTLLACAHMLLGDEGVDEAGFDVEDFRQWGELLGTWKMPEIAEAAENWSSCLTHLLTVQIDVWRGGAQTTIGSVIDRLRDVMSGDVSAAEDSFNIDDARQLLGAAGVTILEKPAIGPGLFLAIPNAGPIIARLFQGTKWMGSGARGVWATALRQGPDGVIITSARHNRARINGVQERCTLINLDAWERLRTAEGDDGG